MLPREPRGPAAELVTELVPGHDRRKGDVDEEVPDTEPLSVTREITERAVVVHAVGEVDHLTAALLATELAKAGEDASQTKPLLADMSSVSFMTSAGLAVLVEHHQNFGAHHALRIVVGDSPVGQSLRRTGLHLYLSTFPTVAAALAAG
jgi:anti-sigma B factor antagonist